jgi:phosphoribosyl-ATP pyrophosphohydrolase
MEGQKVGETGPGWVKDFQDKVDVAAEGDKSAEADSGAAKVAAEGEKPAEDHSGVSKAEAGDAKEVVSKVAEAASETVTESAKEITETVVVGDSNEG